MIKSLNPLVYQHFSRTKVKKKVEITYIILFIDK